MIKLLCLFLLAIAATKAADPTPETPVPGSPENLLNPPKKVYRCNQALMESFDILGQKKLVQDTNFICPGVDNNCCSYPSQLEIFKHWKSSEEIKIKGFYREYPKVFKSIFETFLSIEDMASKVIEATGMVRGSNCNRYATIISENPISALETKVMDAVISATNFLLESRVGMYCSLCDAESHEHYDNNLFSLSISHHFCSKMVSETLRFFNFRYIYFIKLARLYGKFVTSCDFRGTYHKSNMLRRDLQFFRHKSFEGDLKVCRRGLKKWNAIGSCAKYCERFNPVKFDENLEGELDKLVSYSRYIKSRIRRWKTVEKKALQKEKEDDKTSGRRILAEAGIESDEPKHTKKPHLDEDIGELIDFNRQFATTLIGPIQYLFKTDLSIKYNIQFDQSILTTGYEKIYDLVEYKTLVRKEGIDYSSYGDMVQMDREIAKKIFDMINPDQKPAIDIDSLFRKMK